MARAVRTARTIRMAAFLRYLGDPSRVALVTCLSREPQGLYVHEIASALGITHSAASHQLASLEEQDIVERLREGQLVRYTLSKGDGAKRVLRVFRALER